MHRVVYPAPQSRDRAVPVPPRFPHASPFSHPLSLHELLAAPDLFSVPPVLPFPEGHINGIMKSVAF